jgi:predicted ATPase
MASSQVTAGRFVGRAQELARLGELLARAVDGTPLVAVVGGEAGVGKIRLVEQLAATASQEGVRVLRGGCVPMGEEGLPFAPVTEALRGLADQLDPAELEVVVGPARQELGRLLRPASTLGRRATAAHTELPPSPGRGLGTSPARARHWRFPPDHSPLWLYRRSGLVTLRSRRKYSSRLRAIWSSQ